MKREPEGTPIEVMTERLKRLPRRHRIAHLRALIGRQACGSVRGRELAVLLHGEMAAQVGEGGLLR